jgi:hypothetical protein
MMSKSIEDLLAPKPAARPRIYAYSIDDAAHQGQLKVGQTTRDVKQRVAEQVKTAAIKNYTIVLDEPAERDDGSIFSDRQIRAALVKKGFENVELEWVRCAVEDVQTVLAELRTGQQFTGTHHQTFPLRREQAEAVGLTHADVQKWLDIIRGSYAPRAVEHLKTGTRPPLPYSDSRLLPYLQHSFWFLPNVAACHAMANLLAERLNGYWHDYTVVVAAGASAGIGLDALPPVRAAIGSGFDTKTITLSCGKLTTGVTVPQWSSILMLRNLKSPETSSLRRASPRSCT